MVKYLKLLLFLFLNNLFVEIKSASSFNDFIDRVQLKLPYNREVAKNKNLDWCDFGDEEFFKEFELLLDIFYSLTKQDLIQEENWLSLPKLVNSISKFFIPYVQKKMVSCEDTIFFKGDLHGDVHSLVKFLQELQESKILNFDSFKISDPDKYIIFLGDYTDRGLYGVEVIYALLRLKIENPDQVILIRGNHEDVDINARYGFDYEFNKKFKNIGLDDRYRCFAKINKFYNILPVALYLGSGKDCKNFLLCCHGGLEIGFNASEFINSSDSIKYQWIGKLKRNQESKKLEDYYIVKSFRVCKFQDLCKDFFPQDCKDLGFLWHDFVVDVSLPSTYRSKRGFSFNQELSEKIINLSNNSKNKVKGVFRAHQHTCSDENTLMNLMVNNNGVACLWENNLSQFRKKTIELWEGIVCTFLLSPDNPQCDSGKHFKGFDFDTWGILKTAENFEDWTLNLVNNNIFLGKFS